MPPHRKGWFARFLSIVLFAAVTQVAHLAIAGEEHYEYDPLDRLVRVIDEQGRSTQYVYDAAGNLLSVVQGKAVPPPSVTSIAPDALRRGESKSFKITGSALNNVTVSAGGLGLSVSSVVATATEVSLTLSASATATLGAQKLTLANAAGSAEAQISILPLLPKLFVAPTPLAIPPDGTQRKFTLRLSSTDTVAHNIALAVSDAGIATVSPAGVTIAAGELEAAANIAGLKAGQTTITLSSATLGSTVVPVYVTSEFRGINTSQAPLVGVILEAPPPAPGATPQQNAAIGGSFLGVVKGGFIQRITPQTLTIGTGPTALKIEGSELGGVTAVNIEPAQGLTLGAISVSADGKAVTVPVTVAMDAPITVRQVVLSGAGGQYTPASAEGDRIQIVPLPPEITSIEPLFAAAGTSSLPFIVRGRNLQNAQTINFSGDGITAGAAPVVSADGTQLTTAISVAWTAATGARTVTVTAPGGTSGTAATPANTFTVVNEIKDSYANIAAPVVGVVKGGDQAAPAQPLVVTSSLLGVSVGGVVTGVKPNTGVIGETLTLTVQGADLHGVTEIKFQPATGLAAGTPVAAADGKSVTVPLTVAPDAPQTVRAIQVLSGGALLPFSHPADGLFRVIVPQPSIDSVTPLYLRIGTSGNPVTVRGRNFQNAQSVALVPGDGVTVGPPAVSADGAEITLTVSVLANASPGARSVVVTTPAGSTGSTATVANTVTLTTQAGSNYTPVAAAVLGVVKQDDTPPPGIPAAVTATPLGVLVQSEAPPPVSTPLDVRAARLGVALGPVARSVEPSALLPGATATLIVRGAALQDVTSVTLAPQDGVTLGTPTLSSDGLQISVPVSVAATAAPGVREVIVSAASGPVRFSDPAASRLVIATGVPLIESITPILATPGSTFTLTVRGRNLHGASVVSAAPAEGVTFGVNPTVNSDGTELTVGMSIAPAAKVGIRVIRVTTPGGVTAPDPLPANSFTIYVQ